MMLPRLAISPHSPSWSQGEKTLARLTRSLASQDARLHTVSLPVEAVQAAGSWALLRLISLVSVEVLGHVVAFERRVNAHRQSSVHLIGNDPLTLEPDECAPFGT